MTPIAALLFLALPACTVSVDYGDGPYLCEGENASCPDGQSCVDGVCQGEDDEPTSFRRSLESTLDPTVAGGLADVPVLIRLDATRIQYPLAADGANLGFFDAAGNALPHEIERWDASGESVVWVLLPTLTEAVEMRYGEGVVGAPGAVFDQYDGVYHFSNGTANAAAANLLGTPMNGAMESAGRVGNGCALDGVDDFVVVGQDIPMFNGATALTISGWIRSEVTGSSVLEVQSTDVASRAFLGFSGANEAQLGIRPFDGAGASVSARATVGETVGDWHWVVGTADLSAGRIDVYVDGELRIATVDQVFTPDVIANTNSTLAVIGKDDTSDNALVQGAVDEVRWMSRIVEADWVTAQYRSMTDTLLSFGDEQPL